jgi:Na+/H+ antiporter NhaC
MHRFIFIIVLFFNSIFCFAQDTLSVSDSSNVLDKNQQVEALAYDTLNIPKFTLTAERHKNEIELVLRVPIAETFFGNFELNGETRTAIFLKGEGRIPIKTDYFGKLFKVSVEDEKGTKSTGLIHIAKLKNGSIRYVTIPLWVSILPPLTAIFLALIFRQVLLSLFIGIFMGAWLLNGMQLSIYGFFKSLFSVLDTYILKSLMDTGHLSVIIFSMLIGGIVALISRNGGMAGVVKKLSPIAKGPKSSQFLAWLLGIAIFFDDYANTLIVGNTIRPLTDKFRVSREKLAYIVDSTAAPIAAIAFITTWIGAELGYISDALPGLRGLENVPSAYGVFLASLPYSFYSFFTLIFIVIIIFSGRDFGSMYRAEKRARTTGRVFEAPRTGDDEQDLEEMEPKKGAPLRWINGLLPILVIVGGTLLGLIDTGMANTVTALTEKGIELKTESWFEVWSNIGNLDPEGKIGFVRKLGILIGNSDSYNALLWASLAAVITAFVMSIGQRILHVTEAFETMTEGFKTMMPALLILSLAWALALTTEGLSTAEFLTSSMGNSISPYFLPVIIFILAAIIAFSTGSSWSTMAILYPIAIPMTWEVCLSNGLDMDTTWALMFNNIAIVLSASVLGDHCSPISDTTILSSMASNCRHIDHVKTQLPYALTVGFVSILCGYLSTALMLPFIVNLALGVGILIVVVFVFGRKTDVSEAANNNDFQEKN